MITPAARGVEWPILRQAQIAPDVFAIGAVAADCLVKELETWPKPGLVSHVDNGSHDDMDAGTFRRSAAAIGPYLQRLADAGALGCGMGRLRIIGLEAERAMFAATSGVNTHRGAIFGLGLLCAAAGAKAGGLVDPVLPLGEVVARLWGDSILDGPVLLHSHGSAARRRFCAGGARIEAATGFPSIYRIGLPALRRARPVAPEDREAARVEACFALIASVEDTNLLHRGGLDGLRFAHEEARRFIASGGVSAPGWRARAQTIHDSFVARRLSPGGSADLLAMTLFVDAHERPRP
ncbi:triphosphoribosyl-dephospho-CoA synthase MdcB [Bradyrhizobium sacchari]|uniref:Probable 2-(5''-triphosphoribosyl)-3'-dephosphocoenzyme-A synthase n=1 Tax=Bradyrhizobium sacchari TaxID=1399419 RepID=A0A560JS50_9BRAD|nr:triphosphoribosyl-dephospho-CoA synthase MdcB [Bradyrhizobium sacchari]OPY98770.1 triphosphoribosyl-dephospho-CoA synthase MdcB [Bradyrhizobium sacchari]TWB60228.1 triphosphoribosyl-dephospho-CoA synthase [Bradyrhizobium sacchari]TWB73962.1 triphosphoribosyl-dephospho-CoA synthase [Bradyrhizobium sacchari]